MRDSSIYLLIAASWALIAAIFYRLGRKQKAARVEAFMGDCYRDLLLFIVAELEIPDEKMALAIQKFRNTQVETLVKQIAGDNNAAS